MDPFASWRPEKGPSVRDSISRSRCPSGGVAPGGHKNSNLRRGVMSVIGSSSPTLVWHSCARACVRGEISGRSDKAAGRCRCGVARSPRGFPRRIWFLLRRSQGGTSCMLLLSVSSRSRSPRDVMSPEYEKMMTGQKRRSNSCSRSRRGLSVYGLQYWSVFVCVGFS
jgi:hypothetical protein